ncbi:putative alcohol zinc protein [Arthroderma uncinatum]|uniref:putative alcohol zinc protein n=1 Tax=Arthroderma uncinatum TaxID=74035 RepID=UPI00144AD670|nr:putative alcohol zinc protein [Arthroderma uncinatum]KAF3491689.1 putative alcohol zinc protein [Arthroderma uncinatum]
MASTQKAVAVLEIGKPVANIISYPIPEPGENQVQLKVTVAGVNPHDRKVRDTGIFVATTLPAILCNDVVGKVSKIGGGVTDLGIGDRVMSQAGLTPGSTQNGLQEYALAEIGGFSRIPDSITDDEAATLPCNTIASFMALFVSLAIPAPWSPGAKDFNYASTTLLIIGGGSNCGRFGVQLAKLAGIGKIVVVGGHETELMGLGASHVIDRHAARDIVLERIKEVVHDDLIYAFDAVSAPEDQVLAVNALSSYKRGTLARLLPDGPIDGSKVSHKHAGFDVQNVFGVWQANPQLAKEFWKRLPSYLEAGRIKPLEYIVRHGLEAEYVNEVLDRYRNGEKVVKVHIHI